MKYHRNDLEYYIITEKSPISKENPFNRPPAIKRGVLENPPFSQFDDCPIKSSVYR